MVDCFASNLMIIKNKTQHLFVSLVNPLNEVSGKFNEFQLCIAHSR